MFEEITKESYDQCEGEGGGPWRNGVQLSLDLAVMPYTPYDGRAKERISVGRDNKSEIHEAADKDFEVFEHIEDISRGYTTLDGGLALVFL